MELKLPYWQAASLFNPFKHFAMICGVAVGKTFTGSQYAIKNVKNWPGVPGFIGANTYDQLSKATLKEFFQWLEAHGIDYVVDQRPPKHWAAPRLKTYKNVVTTFYRGKATIIYTNVLSKGNNLRGMQFGWYWIDESRDTPLNTHDVILSRLRGFPISTGLVTTTTNAEDWVFQRFVKGNKGDGKFGSIHVKTIESVKHGIITQEYYDLLRAAYSPMMAAQELDALHVNALGGIAYHAASEKNRLFRAPWGDATPNPTRPLIVGCDFNFAPAPCIWMVGQVGPDMIDARTGLNFSDCIHWFGRIKESDMPSTPFMVDKLVQAYPGFFYQVFGDSSGTRGTTSNAGETDYIQMANRFDELGCLYTLNTEQANPLVKNRVEAMNAMFGNALGHVRQTYNPANCPEFDSDVRLVGWKPGTRLGGRGMLNDGGDVNLTHATDGAGYAVYKLFPVGRRVEIPAPLPSQIRSSYLAHI